MPEIKSRPATCRLYLITPPRIEDLAAFGRDLAQALDAGDVAAVQVRLKGAPETLIAAACDASCPSPTPVMWR